MKLKPYAEALLATKEDNEKALAPAKAAKTKAELGMRIAQLGIDIQNAELTVAQASSKHPLDISVVTSALDNLAILERQKSQLVAVEAALFPAS